MEWYWLALISALLSALAAILQKKVLFEVNALRFSLLVSVFIAIFSSFLITENTFTSFSCVTLLILVLKSLINASAFLCIMIALKNLDISRTLPLLAASPMIIALLAFIFLGENLTYLELTGMFLIVSGTYVLELKPDEKILHPFRVFFESKFHKIILLALLLMSVSSILDKVLLTNFKLPPVTFLIIQNYLFLIIFAIFMIITSERSGIQKLFSGLPKNILILIIFIALVTIGYRWLQFESTKIAPVGLVISIKRLSVLFAVLIGAKLFKEENYFRKAIATILIVAGALLIYDH